MFLNIYIVIMRLCIGWHKIGPRCDIKWLAIMQVWDFFFDSRGIFHGQALRNFHGDQNLEVLTAPQQPTLGKLRVSSVVGFEPRTMCHLLGPHFPVFALTNWATLVGASLRHFRNACMAIIRILPSILFYREIFRCIGNSNNGRFCSSVWLVS